MAAILSRPQIVNPLAPGRLKQNIRWIIFKLILVIDGWGISCEIALKWLSQDRTDDKSPLVQVMATKQQAITWAHIGPDLCCHMASLGHKKLWVQIFRLF